MKRALRRLLVALAALVATDQVLQRTALADGVFLGQWIAPFDPPLFTPWQKRRVDDLARIVAGDRELADASTFDAELGWCPGPDRIVGAYAFDWAGARLAGAPLARTKDPARRRVVAVGGSFTQCAEVSAEASWPHLVARATGVEMANLGVAGYGIDQAYLRLLRDGLALAPDEVWLGLLPEGLPRITTLFPPVYRHWSSVVAFKPMFRLDERGALELVPNPAQDVAGALALLRDQRAFVAALAPSDHWVQRTPTAFAPRGTSWAHGSGFARLALTALESGDRDARGLLEPPGAFRDLAVAIVRAMDDRARAAGATLRVVVLPSRPDLRDARRAREAYWSGLVRELRAHGIDCIDLTPALLEAGAPEADDWWMPQEHYAPAANRLVAGALAEALEARQGSFSSQSSAPSLPE